ncbi:hypothetical protein [Flavobacterium solisilvae]|uniref:Uncharacterized protein n=1 Tax=Flavobacterium solisilvae TaxID=1852019 RepID=A0ABX1QUY1_9FLAO|nr:hypothetical protein [Flavobacterium solisilvae]NMH26002.1 hypothetical protein [Flavobacterium solisilvae]
MKQANNVQWIFNTITFLLIMLLSNDINSQEQLDKQLLTELILLSLLIVQKL